MPSAVQLLNTIRTASSRRIPRFLYHLTSKSNYEHILTQGVLKRSDDPIVQGVFTIELTNFFKRWKNHESWQAFTEDSLQKFLVFDQISHNLDDIVILRIPTAKLDPSMLKIRSQNHYFSWFTKNKSNMEELISKNENASDEDLSKMLISQFADINDTKMLTGEIPATMAKHYTRKKQAIEYIYKGDIPYTNVEKIGEVNLAQIEQSAAYDPTKPMHSIFTALLKDTPECQGAELLKC